MRKIKTITIVLIKLGTEGNMKKNQNKEKAMEYTKGTEGHKEEEKPKCAQISELIDNLLKLYNLHTLYVLASRLKSNCIF